MDFFENLAGFLYNPGNQTKKNLKNGLNKSDEKNSRNFSLFSGLYIGVILSFLYLNPQMLYYKESIPLIGKIPSLSITILGEPLFIIGILLLSFIFVVIMNKKIFGLLSYRIGKKLLKKDLHPDRIQSLNFKQYESLFSYTIIPIYFWGFYAVYRLLFTDNIQITTPVFPFFDWTLENIVFWGFLVICLGWKWFIGYSIQRKVFNISRLSGFIQILIEIAVIAAILFGFREIGTFLTPFF